jgi:hypothetical protein
MDSIIPDDLSCFISTLDNPSTDRKRHTAEVICMVFGIPAALLLLALIRRLNDNVRRRESSVD